MDVDKGLVSRILRRAPKEAEPVIRSGVTRAGTVGVQIEHKGVKGWGRDVSAARESWRQNSSMAKHDVGKSDSWEVPMDHFSPTLPNKRPNYGAGNTVGKRMTGVSTGVVKPKKLQPTRVAPRKASGMLPIGQLPIAPSLVGKARGLNLAGVERSSTRALAGQKSCKICGGAVVEDKGGALQHEVRSFDAHRPRLSPRHGELAKRDRSFNPEHNRQRRLGAASALAIGGGLALAGRGAQGVRRATAMARHDAAYDEGLLGYLHDHKTHVRAPKRGKKGEIISEPGHYVDRSESNALHRLGTRPQHMVSRPTRRQGAQIAGGGALSTAGVGLAGYGRSRSNREYR